MVSCAHTVEVKHAKTRHKTTERNNFIIGID